MAFDFDVIVIGGGLPGGLGQLVDGLSRGRLR
jgi:hypothetical protein